MNLSEVGGVQVISFQSKYSEQIHEMVDTCIRLGELGFVTSHGGNISLRIEEDLFLVTPTKVNKRKITFSDIVIINSEGEVVFSENGRKPTGESPIHLNIMKKRPDITGVIHAHPPVLTGFALSGKHILSRPLLPEPILELGPVLEVEYAQPLSIELANCFDDVLEKSNAFLMRNHGILVCSHEGAGRALELLEMLECMAQSAFVATCLGDIQEITIDEVVKLESTMRLRSLPFPGLPGKVKSLKDIY